ncbi:MAG: multiprotein bridging factor aMBF1 [Candidatus Bathyarchaeota archaeon]|nr:multiprotein bridging factor aMBF1 [Candidatus Bathyarchaeota archaeon]MDI6805623.1 multiprotein bridging factor aMBF1 [Candidatus Bathyarchaeia archaeon]
MRCEVCGAKIFGKPFKVIIEGAKLTVCSQCSKHGTIIWEEEPKPKSATTKTKIVSPPPKIKSKKTPETAVETSFELVENFHIKIRQAREKLGLSHEELGKKINEKVSLLKKIETRKMTPDNKLATKLEHVLKVKLLAPPSEEKTLPTKIPQPISRELTLGDIIQLNKKEKEKEDSPQRKPS